MYRRNEEKNFGDATTALSCDGQKLAGAGKAVY